MTRRALLLVVVGACVVWRRRSLHVVIRVPMGRVHLGAASELDRLRVRMRDLPDLLVRAQREAAKQT